MIYIKLFEGVINQVYAVQSINLPAKIKNRLEAFGMINGTKFNILNKKKSALIIIIRGTRLALGKSIAENIEIREI